MTTKTKVSDPTIVFLTPRRLERVKTPEVKFATSRHDVLDLIARAATPMLWIERDNKGLLQFLIQRLVLSSRAIQRQQMLLTLSQWSAAHCALFESLFGRAISSPASVLPPEELAEVLHAPGRRDLCIGGFVNDEAGVVTLVRGDLTTLIVPTDTFANARGTTPDFSQFTVTDYGQTVAFGPYEASMDAVLYERDPEYRRRRRKDELAAEDSLGASIRRLRKQRKLPRTAFENLPARSLARIERGEVGRPHRRTLQLIAETLRVPVEELASF